LHREQKSICIGYFLSLAIYNSDLKAVENSRNRKWWSL